MTAESANAAKEDVRSWLPTQPDIADALAALVAIPSLPGTLRQNDVLSLTLTLADPAGRATRDEFVPSWGSLPAFEAPLDRQRLWCPLLPAAAYAEILPELRVGVLEIDRGPGPTLMLNAHVDVVPADGQAWSSPAFTARVRDNILYARGSMDMKAGAVAAALAFAYLAERWPGPGRLLLALVPEEETGGDGTLAVLHRGHVPDAVVFTEPTDLKVVHRHVGIQRFDVRVAGRPGGILRRSWGDSAVSPTAHVALALNQLELTRTERARRDGGYDSDDLPGFVNTVMRAGDWIATRAAEGEISGLMGVLPGETQSEAAAELEDAVRAAAPDARVEVWDGGHRGAELPRRHPLVRAFADNDESVQSEDRATRGGTMVCDAKIVTGGGWAPAIVLGPRGGNLHGADEWVDLGSIAQTTELLVAGTTAFLASGAANRTAG